jgi:hypothetical protein
VIHDATLLIKLHRILKLEKKIKLQIEVALFMLINDALVTNYTLAIK